MSLLDQSILKRSRLAPVVIAVKLLVQDLSGTKGEEVGMNGSCGCEWASVSTSVAC